jgi:hypothetical protein
VVLLHRNIIRNLMQIHDVDLFEGHGTCCGGFADLHSFGFTARCGTDVSS